MAPLQGACLLGAAYVGRCPTLLIHVLSGPPATYPGFRALNQDIETIINKSESVSKTKKDATEKLSSSEKKTLTEDAKEYKSKRYEDTSLSYSGISRQQGEHTGLYDTVISGSLLP